MQDPNLTKDCHPRGQQQEGRATTKSSAVGDQDFDEVGGGSGVQAADMPYVPCLLLFMASKKERKKEPKWRTSPS